MGFIDRLKAFMPLWIQGGRSTFTYPGQSDRQALDVPRTPRETVEYYRSWVYACVRENAQACAAQTLRLYVRGETQRFPTRGVPEIKRRYLSLVTKDMGESDVREIIDHPLLALLRAPNDQFAQRDMFDSLYSYMDLLGNAFWQIEFADIGGRKVPVKLWPLMAQDMLPVLDEARNLIGYMYGWRTQDQVALGLDEVIHFRSFNPCDQVWGMGPMQAAVHPAARLNAMNEWEGSLWANGARPDFALISDHPLVKEERDELRRDWMRLYGGMKRAGLPAVMPKNMEIKELSFPPKDTGHLLFARFSREEIAAIFDVPMPVLEMSVSNKANSETAKAFHAEGAVLPRITRVADRLNMSLTALFDERLFLAYDDPVPENRDQVLKERQGYLQSAVITPNEVREDLGMPPVEWGDKPLPLLKPAAVPVAPGENPQEPPPDDAQDEKPAKRLRSMLPDGPESSVAGELAPFWNSARDIVHANWDQMPK